MKKQKTPVAKAKTVAESIETIELKKITHAILRKIKAEKIICFGSIVTAKKKISCFSSEGEDINPEPNSYCLLVIPSAAEAIPDILIQQRLEEELKGIANITVIVHRMLEINAALQNNSSFFTKVYRKGVLLHDNEAEPFIAAATGKNISERISKREKFWHQWFALSQSFLMGAHFYSGEQRNNLAVFMLHQSLQHCYSAMLRVLTGYRSNSNSLKRLSKLIDSVLPDSSFSPTEPTPESARLSALLMKGFSDARYNDKFNITNNELSALIRRIEDLLKQANLICQEHIKNLKSGKVAYTG
ncbi:MAG: HEPN domain-containing protein [Pedobacter sp.]|uniref:HEPN domain-containing protein n=1 Tax=Pedobacter sp. TaxID=1411316 RepID=UPI003562D5D9